MAATTTEMGASSDPPALKMESPASSDFYGHGGGSATGGDFACSGFESPSEAVATNGDPYGAGQPSYVDALPPQASPYSLATSGSGGGGDVYPAASGHYPCPAGALEDRPPSLHRQDDPYSFVDDYGDHKGLSSAPAAAVQSQPARPPPQQLPLPLLPFQFPKKRGRKPKKLLEAMAAAGMEVPKYKTPVRSTDPNKPRKKRDRFNGLSEEELIKLTLPDHLTHGMDIVFIGINPGLLSAFKGHHYAGPGDHFWKCIYLAGLIPEPLVAEDDYKLSELKIGFTNVVSRTTKGSQELTRKELKEGGKLLLTKLQSFQPKVAVFNGKGIFEIFSGKKEFMFGKQPETIEGTLTHIWVMPSSSARCAQLPRALDKVPFFVALRKFRDHLNGLLPELDESEIVFQPPKRPPPVRREKDPTAAAAASSAANGDPSGPPPLLDADGQPLAAPVKKKRGRPRKIKLDENGVPLPVKPKPSRPRNVSSSASTASADGCGGDLDGDGGAAARKKRGRPKKMAKTGDLMSGVGGLGGPLPPMSSLPPVGHLNGAGGALPSVYEISGVGPGIDEMTRLGMAGVGGYPTPGPGDYRHDSFSPPYGMSQQQPAAYHHPHLLHHHHQQQQQQHLQQQHMHPADLYGCGGYGAGPPSQLQHYGQSPGYSPAAGSSVYGQSPGVQQGGGGGPLCLTPPPTSPSLDQPDFEAPASMPSTSTDASRESSSGTAVLLGQVKDDTMDGSATNGSATGGVHGQQPAGSYSNPNTPSDPALTQYPTASGAPTPLSQSSPYQPGYNPNNGGVPTPLTQLSPYQPGGGQQQPQYPAVSQSSPFQPLVYATTSSGAPTPLSQSSPYTPGAQQALPIDFSQQQHPPGSVDNRSPSGGGYDESPPGGHHRVGLKSSDIAAKSLSGLESLVDQIPSISHHQSVDSPAATAAALLGVHRAALPGGTSISMPTAAPHIPGSSVGGHPGESPPTDGYSPQHQQQGYGYAGSPYCAGSYSPPSATSLSAQQQQQNGSTSAGSGYSSSNFTAISLASSSVGSGGGLGGSSPGPSTVPPVAGPGGLFSSPAALSAGYGGMSMYHHPYGSYAAAAAAASAAPYSGFHVPSPRFPYPPTAYTAPSPYHPAHHHPSMHPHHPHQNYPPQPSVFERWKQDHMDMRFGGGF